MKYFGKSFTSSLQKLDREQIEKIKIDLKNSYALQKIENPENFWDELDSISFDRNEFLLFQMNPETRVFSEFLNFSYSPMPEKIYSYYTESTQKNSNPRMIYPGVGSGGAFAYTNGIYPIELDANTKLKHQYFFLLKYSKNSNLTKLRVLTRSGNFIDFKFKE